MTKGGWSSEAVPHPSAGLLTDVIPGHGTVQVRAGPDLCEIDAQVVERKGTPNSLGRDEPITLHWTWRRKSITFNSASTSFLMVRPQSSAFSFSGSGVLSPA